MIEKRLLKKINSIQNYQIIGGFLGLLITSYLLFTSNLSKYLNLMGLITMVLPFIFFGLCIYSGYLLKKKNYNKGFNLVLITLFLQVVAFEIGNLFYSSVNGIGIKLTLNLMKDSIVGFDFHPSHFLFQLKSNEDYLIIKFNIVAIIMLFYVTSLMQEIKNFKK